MSVYEIKDPKPTPPGDTAKTRRRNVKPVSATTSIRPIDSLNLKREWRENKDEPSKQKEPASKGAIIEARAIINLINDHLEILKKGIHIALKDGKEGYLLNVHDCSNGKICDKVAELPIFIEDLPLLLKKLQNEAGFLLDKKL